MVSRSRRAHGSVSAKDGQEDGAEAVLMVTRTPIGERAAVGREVRVASTVAAAREAARSGALRCAVVDRSLDLGQRRRLLEAFELSTAHLLFVGAAGGPESEHVLVQLVAAAADAGARPREWLRRVPVKHANEIVLLPASQIASLEADGEMVHLTTLRGDRHTAAGPLTALEARLDPAAFIRLSRGVVVSVDAITRLRVLPTGSLAAVLSNGAEMAISRSQAPTVRQRLVNL